MAKEKKTRSLKIMNMHIPYHVLMIVWSFIAVFPLYFLMINTFKVKKEIYTNFFGLPKKWTLENYQALLSNSDFFVYFRNSFLVVVISLFMILLLGSLCAFALAHWRTKFSKGIYYFFVIGMMLPIKIATIRLLQIMKVLNTLNTLFCLYPIYIAMGLPTAVFILTEFVHGLPGELYEAAYMDGASRFRIWYRIVVPLIRPALATVAIYNLVPIWNDLWFPLIFITKESSKTVLLAVTRLQGQYSTDWPKVLTILAMSALPVIALYLTMAQSFIKGLTAGAVKG
ncbi:MAG: carbohydrate ABC transporter permease [Clostridia bacterium]|nr:carbohydrate ABC transporter permease [Clostridia bacterium]MBR7175518.1 carbohydrate ABC transporter permease [Clostridia bacterium]